MSPKSRKGKTKFRKLAGVSTTTQTPFNRQTSKTSSAAQDVPVSVSQPAVVSITATPGYEHVIRDIKLIGIIAGSFIALLIIFSFIFQ